MNWQQQQLGKAKRDYAACLSKVGEAHLAAEEDNVKARIIEQQKVKNRKIALQRGKEAMGRQLAEHIGKTGARKDGTSTVVGTSKKRSVTVATQVNDSVNSSNMSSGSSISSLSSSSSTLSIDMSYSGCGKTFAEKLQAEYRPKSALKSFTRNDSNFEQDLHTSLSPERKPSIRSPRVYETVADKEVKRNSFALLNGNDSPELLIPQVAPTITKVSDLLKEAREKRKVTNEDQPIRLKSSLHRRPGQDEFSSKSSPKPIMIKSKTIDRMRSPKPILKKPRLIMTSPKQQPKPILKTGANKIQKTPKKPAVKQTSGPEKQEFHYVPRFISNTKSVEELSSPSILKQKVQFYDHANRYGTEYDLPTDIVRKERKTGLNALENAFEETQKNTQYEQRRILEMAEAR